MLQNLDNFLGKYILPIGTEENEKVVKSPSLSSKAPSSTWFCTSLLCDLSRDVPSLSLS